MGRRKRSRYEGSEGAAEAEDEPCTGEWCLHGGTCVRAAGVGAAGAAGARRVCACADAWGGARCALYVAHDHACRAKGCAPPALCVWGPDEQRAGDISGVYCACPLGATCGPPPRAQGGGPPVGAAGGAWVAAVLVVVSLAAIAAVAALFFVHRRRQGAFVHARLADNVEISNPMYLAGEDEIEPHNHTHANGGNHFANPVYESMYAAQQNNPTEEHANLLASAAGDGSPPPPERAALL